MEVNVLLYLNFYIVPFIVICSTVVLEEFQFFGEKAPIIQCSLSVKKQVVSFKQSGSDTCLKFVSNFSVQYRIRRVELLIHK